MGNSVTINKNGSSIQIIGYTANGTTSTSDMTITNPNGVKVWATGTVKGQANNTVNIDLENYPAFKFTQTAVGNNLIASFNGVDTSAYDADQMVEALNLAFTSGFETGLPIVFRQGVAMNLTTSATGTTWVAFASQACNGLDVINTTGTALEYRRDGAGLTVYIADSSSRMIGGITNANQIQMRRQDVSNTQVTFTAEAIIV